MSRVRQIWLGQSIDPDKAAAYRKCWVKRHADELGISQQEAYQLLCEQYGEPPEPLTFPTMPSKLPCDEHGKPVLPSLLRRAMNFGKAAVAHLADGRRKLPESESAARLEICQGCELFLPAKFACADKRCGCNLRVKATWASETCPQGKWPEIEKSG